VIEPYHNLQVVGKHSPNKKFQTETLIKVLVEAGEHVQDQVVKLRLY
jgi:hypothetical protein